MAKCNKCTKAIPGKEKLMCSQCRENYHFSCVKMSKQDFTRLSISQCLDEWLCDHCKKNEEMKTRNAAIEKITLSPNRSRSLTPTFQAIPRKTRQAQASTSLTSSTIGTTSVRGEEIHTFKGSESLLEKMNDKMSLVLEEVRDIKKSNEFLNSKYDELLDIIKQQALTIKNCMAEVEILKKEGHIKDNYIMKIQDRLNQQELNYRQNSIEICGISSRNKEDETTIVERVAAILQMNKERVQHTRMVIPRIAGKKSSIVVELKSNADREAWLLNRKKIFTNNDILGNSDSSRIHVNENLPSYFKELLFQAKLKANNKYKFVWYKNGNIYLKRMESDVTAIRIRNEADLKKIT